MFRNRTRLAEWPSSQPCTRNILGSKLFVILASEATSRLILWNEHYHHLVEQSKIPPARQKNTQGVFSVQREI